MTWHANGNSAGIRTSSVPSAFSSSSSNSVTFKNRNRYGEIFIFRNALSDRDRQTIESHMAIKWGMTGKLPMDHLYNTNGGWSLAKGIQENSLLSNIKGIEILRRHPIPPLYPRITNGTTSYHPMMAVHERSTLTARRYHPHPHQEALPQRRLVY